jgi:hypothetical protein
MCSERALGLVKLGIAARSVAGALGCAGAIKRIEGAIDMRSVAGAFGGRERSRRRLIVARRSEAFRSPVALGGAVFDNGIGLGLHAINRSLAGAGVARRDGQKQNQEGGTSRVAFFMAWSPFASGRGPPHRYQMPKFPADVFRKCRCLSQMNVSHFDLGSRGPAAAAEQHV